MQNRIVGSCLALTALTALTSAQVPPLDVQTSASPSATQPVEEWSAATSLSAEQRVAHAVGVFAERRAALIEEWRSSTDEGRAAARAHFLARRGLGLPAMLAPNEASLAIATRLLRGEVAPGAPYPAVVSLADALDLRLVPGALEAGVATGATVHFGWAWTPQGARLPESVTLRLAVVSPVPGEAHRVTTIGAFACAPRGLTADGLDVPVLLPALDAGEHWLAFEVEDQGHVVPGFFVPVEVVEGLATQLAARPLPDESPLGALVRHGVRGEGRGALTDWFQGDAEVARRSAQVSSRATGFLGVDLDQPARLTVFVDVPPPSEPANWLAGSEGRAWRQLIQAASQDGGARVIALCFEARKALEAGEVDPAAVTGTPLGVFAAAAAADPGASRVLVARGERLAALTALLEGQVDLFQGLVLVGGPNQPVPRGWGPTTDTAGPLVRTTIVVECFAQVDSAAVSAVAPFVTVSRAAPPHVAALEVPALLAGRAGAIAQPIMPGASAPNAAAGSQEAAPEGAAPRAPAPEGMARIPATTQVIDGRSFPVPSFFADKFEVSNREFAAFVAATGYVTDAERIGDSVCYIDGAGPLGEPIFAIVPGAEWRHPEGPMSSLEGRWDHPVVHVSWNDATAFATWRRKRLPTREEWHAMARGDAMDQVYPWGDSLLTPKGYAANTWQGTFPLRDEALDGFHGTAPVGAFPPGTNGLYDLGGNVWEWTAERSFGLPAGCAPGDAPEQDLAATRGGSYLCREEAAPPFHACHGYRIGPVEYKPLIDGNSQVGFRCVRSE
ncbi:MAG: SUMF1/EgtB/PvdO family nonheme iron enzyme [Planctomycetota bacterium]